MKFYPSLKSCQRALKLFIPLYPLGIPLLAYLFWFNSIFTIIICLGTKSFEGLLVLISLGILLGLIIYYEIVLVIYQFLLKILWKNPPQVISLPPTVWRNLYHLGVGVLGQNFHDSFLTINSY